uniref:Shisa N-terminal domain-containing protein n=1 Tax=Gopherus agassizii TaxID=38772 RepID=A0A452I5H1_9SAUR
MGDRGLLLRYLLLGFLGWGASAQPAGGEYCHGWVDGHGRYHEGFPCPEDFDTPDATICSRECPPIYVPFLIVGSIFIAFIVVGSLVAVYCCTCLRPKQTSQQPIRFSLRSYQIETLPMILTSTSLRTPSRQSSTATSSSSTGGSIRRFSFARAESGCLVASPPSPYTPGCLQTGHSIHLSQPAGFLVSSPYFGYPLQPEPSLAERSCPDFS